MGTTTINEIITKLTTERDKGLKQEAKDIAKVNKAVKKGVQAYKKSAKTKEKAIKLAKKAAAATKKVTDKEKEAAKAKQVLATASKALTKSMLGVGLSMLFTGMAVKRLAMGIIRAGVSAFTTIQESAGLAAGAVGEIGVWFEYLKYVLGSVINEALEPYKAKIIEIINKFSEWLKDHKKLVFWALILAAVLGTIMMVLGQTVLAAVGVLALKVAFASLGTLLTGTILVVLGWIALAMGVLIALWILDVNGFKKYWSSIFGRIWDGMKQFFTNLVYGFKSIFVAIGKLLEGNVAGFASYLLKGFAQIFLGIISLMQGFANMFVQLMIWIAKTALKIFIGLFIDPFVYAIAKLIRFWAAAAAKLGMKSTAKMAYNVANSVEGVGSSLKSGVDTGADWMSTKYDNQVQKIQNVIGDVSITIKNLETDNPAEMGKGIWDALYKEIKENM